ncbi:probable deoxycytidylate deaminase [Pyrus x bretschneideri]|uniref:probable deoxycytidylate deaminase n=1 Tax=Pyrus x bretschneideri TaxID=225117 RepID=UPI00202F77A7|nr:probable deoxycytidylate deaminase [Pyrus x bretschneideri]
MLSSTNLTNGSSLRDFYVDTVSRLYVTMFPCNECAKIIIQSGVAEVVYFVEKRLNNPDVSYIASHKLLSLAGVKVRKRIFMLAVTPFRLASVRICFLVVS